MLSTGVYADVCHPQTVGFVLGFLLQWPTPALAMFPILVFMYMRLAHTEESEAIAEFGPAIEQYLREVPAFIPLLGSPSRLSKTDAAGRK